MDILSPVVDFNTLSMQDLLRARDQFHPHLMHKANVIGTAVGRYRIRKGDLNPSATLALADRSTPERGKDVVKPPRTLANSEVRPNSWPCILVFVRQWARRHEFGPDSELRLADYIPQRIYLDDGRVVPICVVEAAPDEDAPLPSIPGKA